MSEALTGKVSDPQFRRERARKARAAQNFPDYYIKRLVDEAPPLTAEQRARLASLLARPAAGGEAA